MTAKHTPGPWNHGEDGFVYSPCGKYTLADPHYADLDIDEREANARLIAAAPELLAACEQALKVVDAHRRASGGDGDITAALIRSAIAKAKGGA